MTDFLKMDIFFVVTTIAVIVISILLVFVLIRVLRILKNIEDISSLVEEEGKALREDLAQMRESVKTEGVRIKHLIGLLGFGASLKKRVKKKKKKETTDS
jgi:uncharacterized membrane protein